jgi:Trk-type K+ transport system membrane component
MAKGSSAHSSGGCLGLLMTILCLAAIIGIYFWSTGMAPQEAIQTGIVYASSAVCLWSGGICCLIASLVAGVMALKASQ